MQDYLTKELKSESTIDYGYQNKSYDNMTIPSDIVNNVFDNEEHQIHNTGHKWLDDFGWL